MNIWNAVALTVLLAGSVAAAPLKAGDKAPDFTMPLSNGTTFRLSDNLAKAPIILYFYPKDFTPGCTREACTLRDAYPHFQDFKATVIGVSYDSIKTHRRFARENGLPFPLASDADKKVAKAYGVDGILFAQRATFIIDKRGVIVWANPKVDPSKHSAELEEALKKFVGK